ncbi:MAG: hypothetical protein AAF721_04425 [Myxococcota bacterium]
MAYHPPRQSLHVVGGVGLLVVGAACSSPEGAGDSAPLGTGPNGAAGSMGDSGAVEGSGSGDEAADSSTTSGVVDGSSEDTSTGGASDTASTGAPSTSEEVSVEITFDEYDYTAITDQYAPYAVFSSVEGSVNETTQSAAPWSEPNFICTTDDLCHDDTYVDFGYPVSDLQFVMIGAADPAAAAARVLAGDVELAYVVLDDDPTTEDLAVIDLSAYEGVTRLELVDIQDDAGVGWDHFTFVAHVPR